MDSVVPEATMLMKDLEILQVAVPPNPNIWHCSTIQRIKASEKDVKRNSIKVISRVNHTDILSSFILPLFSYLKEEIFQEAKEVASCSVQYKKFWQHVAL